MESNFPQTLKTLKSGNNSLSTKKRSQRKPSMLAPQLAEPVVLADKSFVRPYIFAYFKR